MLSVCMDFVGLQLQRSALWSSPYVVVNHLSLRIRKTGCARGSFQKFNDINASHTARRRP